MKYLIEKEEKLLLRTLRDTKGKKAERDYMMMLIGFNCGLRASEIIGLNVGDLRGKEELYIRPEIAKRSKERIIHIKSDKPNLQVAIRNFIKMKVTWREGIHDEDPMFVSKKGGRLSKRSLQETFQRWCIQVGLVNGRKAAYSVHSMRHSFAKRMVEREVKLTTVQKLLGHSSLASTGIYTEASRDEMREAVNAR